MSQTGPRVSLLSRSFRFRGNSAFTLLHKRQFESHFTPFLWVNIFLLEPSSLVWRAGMAIK